MNFPNPAAFFDWPQMAMIKMRPDRDASQPGYLYRIGFRLDDGVTRYLTIGVR